MNDDSEIGTKSLHEGVPVPAAQDKVRVPDSVIINPHFTIQEMPPGTCDPRGQRGAEYRVTCRDDYVEIRLRRSGQKVRVYLNP